MENKKLKLTISGKPKKSFKNFETSKSQGKHSVVIEKSHNKFAKKGSSFRPNKVKFSTKAQINPNDFEKRKLAEQRATKRLKTNAVMPNIFGMMMCAPNFSDISQGPPKANRLYNKRNVFPRINDTLSDTGWTRWIKAIVSP